MLPEYSFFAPPVWASGIWQEPFPTNKFIIPSNDGYGIILMLYIVNSYTLMDNGQLTPQELINPGSIKLQEFY
uniref:hypothetical protein n=1 Tax=Escherichia coli TaxID=562 RepID=UPI00301036E3